METLKFELHDMATMMTALLCFLFATMIVASGKFRPISAGLLAGFFLSQSFVSLHELVLYGDQFRYTVLNSSPNWFYWQLGLCAGWTLTISICGLHYST